MTDKNELNRQAPLADDVVDRPLPTLPVDERNKVSFRWREYELLVDADHLGASGQAELTFWRDSAEYRRLLLPPTMVNLISASARASLIKQLQDSDDSLRSVPWQWIVTCITYKVLKNIRQGEPVEEIWPSEDSGLTPTYLLEPILYLNHPTVIFGDYGSLKSLLALVVAYVAQLPYADNPLGLTTSKESAISLFCDYEDDSLSFRKRWAAIQRGFGIEAMMPILYRRMATPVADSIESLGEIKRSENIGLLIVDSLGPAVGGNLNDPEPALRYYEALRKLGVTSLTLAHNSKDPLTKKRTIFGSVFFTNLARSVWEAKVEQEVGESEAIMVLKHHKANLSKLHPPLSYKFTFTDNAITITKADLRDTELSAELPLPWQIKNLLRRGSFTEDDIADQLNTSKATISRTLRRMKAKNQVLKLEDKTWALPLLEE
jgi:hypothetical protein